MCVCVFICLCAIGKGKKMHFWWISGGSLKWISDRGGGGGVAGGG